MTSSRIVQTNRKEPDKTSAQIEGMVRRAMRLFERYEQAFEVDEQDNLVGTAKELYNEYFNLREDILGWVAGSPWLKHLARSLP